MERRRNVEQNWLEKNICIKPIFSVSEASRDPQNFHLDFLFRRPKYENQEALFRLALHRHGLTFSESESDSDGGCAEFDYTHEQNKPPPLDPEFIRKNLIVIHPKEIENVWINRMKARSKKTELIKEDSVHSSIYNGATTFVPDVENNSGISEKKRTNQKQITEHDSPNTYEVEAEMKYADPKSHSPDDSFMETTIQGQSSLEEITNLVANKSSVTEIGKLSQKKKNKKKKSVSEKNMQEISAERESPSFVQVVGHSVSTKVDAEFTAWDNAYLQYASPEMIASENDPQHLNVISPKVSHETVKIDGINENGKNTFVSSDDINTVDKPNTITKIKSMKQENVHEEKITTKPILHGNLQEQINCVEEISSTAQLNGIKKKKFKYVPCNILDEKFSTTKIKNKVLNQQNLQKNKKLKEKYSHYNNITKMDNKVDSYQQLATSSLVNWEINNEFYFPPLNTNLIEENDEIPDITEKKTKNIHEEEVPLQLTPYNNVNQQDQTNNCNREPNSANTEASYKKNKKIKFSPIVDKMFSSIPPVSHTQQSSLNKLTYNKEVSSEKTASGTKKKTKIQLKPCDILSTVTSKAEFSYSQQIIPNDKTPTRATFNEMETTGREVQNWEVTKYSVHINQELIPILPYTRVIDKMLEISNSDWIIHPTGDNVTDFRIYDEEMRKQFFFVHYELNHQQNIGIISTNNRETSSGRDNVVSGVRKKNKKKVKVTPVKLEHAKTEKNIKVDFPCNLDMERLGRLKQNNSCCITGFSTFNENIKEHEDRTYQKKKPYYEENTAGAYAKFDTSKDTNLKTISLLPVNTELERTFSETGKQIKERSPYKSGYRPETLWVDNYFKNIQYELDIHLYRDYTLETNNFKELDNYAGMCMDFISNTGEQKRVSVLVELCHDYSDFVLTENAETDNCLRNALISNESTKETRNERDTLTERNEEEMLQFIYECEESNGASVGKSENNILIKADKTITDIISYHKQISYNDEKYSDNELRLTFSNPIKKEINQKSIREAKKTFHVPYHLKKIVYLLLVCVFLHLVISFISWVIDNYLPLMLFFMCFIILNIAGD